MEHDSDGNVKSNWYARSDPQNLGKGAGTVGNQRTNRDHPNYSIVKIGQNTEKDPQHLKRLFVTQTPSKNHQLTLL